MADFTLVSTIAAAFSGAWLLGIATQRLKLSPIVGYLVAGVLIGPHTPGFVGDVGLANQLAEIGVILLMFGVGLHFHLKDLLAVRAIAVPGALGQGAVAAVIGWVTFLALGETSASSAVIGTALAVASTVVLMRVLMDADSLDTPAGHVVVGWLLVEDVLTVVVLVLIPVIGAAADGGSSSSILDVAVALAKLAGFIGVSLWLGPRVIPWIMLRVARLRSRELFTLTVLVFSVAVATAAYVFFGASVALGAFLAGMLMGQSPVASQVAADALPLRDAFAVLFFVSVGMLFDPAFLIDRPLAIAAALGIVLIVKPIAALVLVRMFGGSSHVALTVAIGLAQVGEFSFILSETARSHGLMSDAGHSVLVAAAILSITLNPILFRWIPRIERWIERRPRLHRWLNAGAIRRGRLATRAATEAAATPHDSSRRRGIVVGYGPVGRSVDRMLREAGLDTVIVDLNIDTVGELEREGRAVVYGDASRLEVLERAGVEQASHLVVTLPRPDLRSAIVAVARDANRDLRILVRAHYLSERGPLEQLGANAAVYEEAEAAVALARLVLADAGAAGTAVEDRVRELRLRLVLDDPTGPGSQSARAAMIAWNRVPVVPENARGADVTAALRESSCGAVVVTDATSGEPRGFLLARDSELVLDSGSDWSASLRRLGRVDCEARIREALAEIGAKGEDGALVISGGAVVGLLTDDAVIDLATGAPAAGKSTERDAFAAALASCAIVATLDATSLDEAIVELARRVEAAALPEGCDVAARALAREREVSTDVGSGVAIPHVRASGLREPLLAFGRSSAGLPSSAPLPEPIRFVFLLITPEERPKLQLEWLARVARIAGDGSVRDRLASAANPAELRAILVEADRGK